MQQASYACIVSIVLSEEFPLAEITLYTLVEPLIKQFLDLSSVYLFIVYQHIV